MSGFTEQSWQKFDRPTHQAAGYKYDNVRLEPINNLSEEAQTALDTGRTFITAPSDNNSNSGQWVAVPIRLRGNAIGVVNIHFQFNQSPEKTISMIEQVTE